MKDDLAGQIVSINLQRGAFFGVGSLWLSSEVWFAEVPDDLSPEDYDIIREAIRSGDLFLGKVKTTLIPKDEKVLSNYVVTLKETRRLTEEYKETIRELLRERRRVGGYLPQEILRTLLAAERNGFNREEFITFLEEALRIAEREMPEFLEAQPGVGEDAYEVFIDPEHKRVVGVKKPEKKPKSTKPKSTRKSKKSDRK